MQFKSVEQIMSNETIRCCFGQVVEKFLCGESYWFLNEVGMSACHSLQRDIQYFVSDLKYRYA